MPQYIGSYQNDRFDVRTQELVSTKKWGIFEEKTFFRVLFWVFFLYRGHFCTNLHEILAPWLKLILLATLFYKKKSF